MAPTPNRKKNRKWAANGPQKKPQMENNFYGNNNKFNITGHRGGDLHIHFDKYAIAAIVVIIVGFSLGTKAMINLSLAFDRMILSISRFFEKMFSPEIFPYFMAGIILFTITFGGVVYLIIRIRQWWANQFPDEDDYSW